ncbi:hypothetical protein GW915_00680 [bacterium]|nr:hypothetical protein [bacterium]
MKKIIKEASVAKKTSIAKEAKKAEEVKIKKTADIIAEVALPEYDPNLPMNKQRHLR